MTRIGRLILAAILAGALIAAGLMLLRPPQADGRWTAEQARTATATLNADGTITLHNVRDWAYGDKAVLSRGWSDVTVDPRTIRRVWFLSESFSRWKAIGHTFLSFEFGNGVALSFSVEARMKAGQAYSAWRGAFGAYPLAYQWGTERDFVTRRVIFLPNPLRLYPLTLPPKTAQALFRDLAEETNALARKPRLYNTLTENCTNTLAYIVNRHAPHTLPWSLAWYLPGYADGYLMKRGFIALDGGSIEGTKSIHDLTPERDAIRAIAAAPPPRFSASLRAIAAKAPLR